MKTIKVFEKIMEIHKIKKLFFKFISFEISVVVFAKNSINTMKVISKNYNKVAFWL